jgi:predicted Zn-dependent peptidase
VDSVGRSGYEPDEFEPIAVAPGVVFGYLPESKWKTLSINVFCKIPVNEEIFTSLALVPRLNTNGTSTLPSIQHVARFLEGIYGGRLGSDASKVGPVQVIRFTVEVPSPKYLSSKRFGEVPGSIEFKMWSFLWDIVTKPYLENRAYPAKMFAIEREEHRRDIMGLINNPPSYAVVRLIEEISRGDHRGLPPWGSLERLESVEPAGTWDVWTETLSECPISIYAIGEGADEIGKVISENGLTFPRGRTSEIVDISKELTPPLMPEGVVRVEEGFPGHQTVLTMGFAAGVTPKDPEFPALLFLDGLLGGFPHSKIFSVVREKESLAYFADTIVDAWRGMIITITGISDNEKDRVQDLIVSQMDVLKRGGISDEEMDNTRAGLIRRLRTEADYQGSIVNRMLNHEILGGARTGEEIVAGVSKVTKDDVVRLANQTELKAVYVLRAEGDGQIVA